MTCVVNAQTYTSGEWIYTLSAPNEATITAYSGPGGEVVIPASLDGIPVRALGLGQGTEPIFGFGNLSVNSVTIPDGVTIINGGAFGGCATLSHVSIPNTVTFIGSYAFYECSSLTEVYIPDSVTHIDTHAFYSCQQLRNVTLGRGIDTIGTWAFYACSNLETVLFLGDSPSNIEDEVLGDTSSTVSHRYGKSGWDTSFGGRPIQIVYNLDPDADGVNDYREASDGSDPDDSTSFNPLSKGLVVYYPFNGDFNDESGNSNDLNQIVDGFTTEDRFGQFHSALKFTTTSGVATSSNVMPFGGNADRTISFWLRLPAGGTGWQGIGVGWGDHNIAGSAGSLVTLAGENAPRLDLWGAYADVNAADAISHDQWHHAVVVYSGSLATARLYVDGRMLTTTSLGTLNSRSDLDTAITALRIGGLALADVTLPEASVDEVRAYNRALSSSEVEGLFYSEAFSDIQKQFLVSTPRVMGHYSQDDYDLNRTNGQSDVTTYPSAFNLFTQTQLKENRTAGQLDVITQPELYELYTADSIMDLNLGGVMIQKQGNNVTLTLQVEKTDDLTSMPFEPYGTFLLPVSVPGNKSFLRIRALQP